MSFSLAIRYRLHAPEAPVRPLLAPRVKVEAYIKSQASEGWTRSRLQPTLFIGSRGAEMYGLPRLYRGCLCGGLPTVTRLI